VNQVGAKDIQENAKMLILTALVGKDYTVSMEGDDITALKEGTEVEISVTLARGSMPGDQ